MWRSSVYGALACRAFRVLAATKVVGPAAEQRRWSSSNIKMTKVLKKMFDRRGGSKKKWFPGPVNVRSVTIADQALDLNPAKKPVYSEGQKRRAHQVGRVLYDNIVQLINSGQLSPQLAALSVEIVRVKVVPNFSTVNVYWLSTGYKEDEIIETLLKEHEGLLRQLLTSYHVLGTIPRINFVRDDSRAHYLEVESLLSKADFGADFVPTQPDTSIQEYFTLRGKLDSTARVTNLQAQFDQLNVQCSLNSAERCLSETRLNEKEEAPSSGEGQQHVREESAAVKKSSSECSGYLKECLNSTPDALEGQTKDCLDSISDAVEGKTHQEHHSSPVLSCQPCCLDAQQLRDQFLSDATTASGNISCFSTKSSHQQKVDSVCDGFRDDLYKVPHSELLNKILIRKQRAGTRPAIYDRAKEGELLMPKVGSSSFKLMVQKKTKSKGRLVSQSDYHRAGTDGFSRMEESTEDDGVSDEELDERSARQTDDELFPGK